MTQVMNSIVASKFNSYPEHIREHLLALRQLILETAKETNDAGEITESLKWGEPSFASPKGSPIRIDWKEAKPDQYAMYFNCKTTLIETFKELFGDELQFESNRAIILKIDQELPAKELQLCISLALTYHQIKHLPMLGF